MRKVRNNNGFSLTEVLFAVATLAIGMLFIAGTFPVAIYFSTIATERTIAAVAADEAFAKIRLYADPNEYDAIYDINMPYLGGRWQTQTGFNDANAFPAAFGIDPNEFAYPSTGPDITQKKYFWSALCRQVDPAARLVQVTVFVSRKVGEGGRYRVRNSDRTLNQVGWFYPVPVDVNVSQVGPDELSIDLLVDPVEKTFINDGYTIVDDRTGQIYRVLERYAGAPPIDQVIKLDRPWQGGPTGLVWVVPPPVNGGRYPCIAVYQKVIRF